MQLIPVIDLKNGLVVHAQKGQRENYQPIDSKLAINAELNNIIQGFLSLYPFKIFYIADLNAITQTGDHLTMFSQLLTQYPNIEFWIDSGYQARPNILNHYPNYRPVLGSESYSQLQLSAVSHFNRKFILSLDFSAQEQPLGAIELFNSSKWWPDKVIIMTLSRVGSKLGIDIDKLKQYQSLNPSTTLIASGGIRHLDDMKLLQQIKINYALCATALHYQMISAIDLKSIHD